MTLSTIEDHNYAECHYAECCCADCHARFIYYYAKCHNAECCYPQCHYAECHGAIMRPYANGIDTQKLNRLLNHSIR